MIGRGEMIGSACGTAGLSPHCGFGAGRALAGALALAWITLPALATDPLALGNERLRAGDAAGALAAYGEPGGASESPRLRLARAVASIHAARGGGDAGIADPGVLAQAERVLRDLAISETSDTELLRTARANLGALLAARAEATAQADRPLAVDLFKQAAAEYLAASRLDASDVDAARNVEHARSRAAEIMRELGQTGPSEQERQNQRQRQQQAGDQPREDQGGNGQEHTSESQPGDDASQESGAQQQQEQADELAQRLSELAEQQRQEAEDSESGEQDGGAAGEQQEITEQTGEQLEELERQLEAMREGAAGEQAESGDAPGDAQDGPQDASDGEDAASPQESLERARDAADRARSAQQRAEQSLEQSDRPAAARAQREAAERLAEAARQAGRAAEKLGEQASEGQRLEERAGAGEPEQAREGMAQAEPAQRVQASPQGEPREGDPLVDRLLERERRQREQRAVSRPGRPVRVERDW